MRRELRELVRHVPVHYLTEPGERMHRIRRRVWKHLQSVLRRRPWLRLRRRTLPGESDSLIGPVFPALRRASGALVLLLIASDAHAGSVQVFLSQDGRDVSETPATRVVFTPRSGTNGPPVECAPKGICAVSPGQFTISLRSSSLVALDRPKYLSDTAADVPTKRGLVLRVVPAAFVELGPHRFPPGSVLTVMDVESGLNFKSDVGSDRTSLQIPARSVLAAIFREDAILDLWKPLALKPGERRELPENPPMPKGKSHLVVSLLFPASRTSGGNRDVSVRWKSNGSALGPNIAVTGDPWRWTGFWFDIPTGEGSLEVESKAWALAEPARVEAPDRATGFARELKVVARPRLKARFEQNGRLPSGEAEVDLLDCRRLARQSGPPQYSLCTHVSSRKTRTDSEFAFEGLDPVPYALQWQAGSFRDLFLIDLSDSRDKDVTIPVAIHLVKGLVSLESRPLPGTTVTWHHFVTGLETATETDADGRYEVLLAPSGEYLAFIDGPAVRRHAEALEVGEDREADFVVPANSLTARVVDAVSGSPIANARVEWHLEAKGPGLRDRGEPFVCDESGRVTLPPSPPGRVTLVATARGYRRSEEKRLDIDERTSSADLEFRLTKGAETRIRLTDTGGRPAQGAWAALPSGPLTPPADSSGETYFEVPVLPGDPVFAASAQGSIVLTRFGGEDTPIRIGTPSSPFTVRFLSADGRPAPQVHISYSIDGIEVPPPMAWNARRAAGGDAYSRRDGTLVIAGLPPTGTVTLWPTLKRDAAVTRPLPITEVLELPQP